MKKLITIIALLPLLILPASGQDEERIKNAVYQDFARAWVLALLENQPESMAKMSEVPFLFLEMDIETKEDLKGMLASPAMKELQKFHGKNGLEFAKVLLLEGERHAMVAKRSFETLDADQLKLVFVRLVDDAAKPRGGGVVHDLVVAIREGKKPVVVAFGGD